VWWDLQKKTQRWFFKQRAEILIYLRDPFSRKEREKTIDSSSLPIIDRLRLPCFHGTFFFSPLQQHPWVPQKRKYMEASSTSAVLMVETADMAQLLIDGHRIEDFQHNLYKNLPSQYVGCKAMGSSANFLLPLPARCSKVTSKHDMSVQITRPLFALGTLVCSFDRIFRGEFRTSNLS
jgi:hypothetical protein